jgi:hypothetical protein
MDDERIAKILKRNKTKDFVKRILEPEKYPKLDMGGGVVATHIMSWGEQGGKYYVYPTVIHQRGKLHRIHGPNAMRYAIQTGENIEFDNPRDADQFSKEYKRYWMQTDGFR